MVKFDSEEFFRKITSVWGESAECPMCHSRRWVLDKTMFTPITVTENGGIAVGNSILPLIPVTCQTCGNTVFVNAKVIGAVHEIDTELREKKNER